MKRLKEFFYSTFLFFCAVLSVVVMVIVVPIIGEWLKSTDIDGMYAFWCVVAFFVIGVTLFHSRMKEQDRKWLSGENDEEVLGYYKDAD